MQVEDTNIKGVKVIIPTVFGDNRGYFFESFNKKSFEKVFESNVSFVQDNESESSINVLRGLHFQRPPFDQGKLVRVIKGKILDVVVDIRDGSETYGEYFKIELDAKSKKMVWIPSGMAHGFVSLEDRTIFAYKCTNYYSPESEGCILWNDQDLNINWGVENPIVSVKDANGIQFKDFKSPFQF